MKHLVISLLLLSGLNRSKAQTQTFFTLSNNSVLVTYSEKTVFVYHSNKSCIDCFSSIYRQLAPRVANRFYFIIERNHSAMANYNIYSQLCKTGISKDQILFTALNSQKPSPYMEIRSHDHSVLVDYHDIFDSKETLQLSQKVLLTFESE